jgi:hypothetical protein
LLSEVYYTDSILSIEIALKRNIWMGESKAKHHLEERCAIQESQNLG